MDELVSNDLKTDSAIKEKICRLRQGTPIRTLDLFAGCGGLSLGFQSAGFKIVGAMEIDPVAAESHAQNLFKSESKATIEHHAKTRDITKISPEQLVYELNFGQNVENSVDVIIGGPPCQAFARVGRAKLREISAHPEAFLQDPRGNLYLRYLHYIEKLKPVAILIENVPDVINYGGHNIPEEICEVLTEMGYICGYTLLNAVHYGVPQMRDRMFLIAYADMLGAKVVFPSPTHWAELPIGYYGSRQVALKSIKTTLINWRSFYIQPPESKQNLKPAINAEDALGDLPPITIHLEGKLKRGARRFNEITLYPKAKQLTEYAKLMRNWPGFESVEGILDHVIRYLPRDYRIFCCMKPGDQYPEACQHAVEIFNNKLEEISRQGTKIEKGTLEYNKLMKEFVPPYDPKKFPNKWRKMEPNRPARTLMAHLGKDSYSHIHYESKQARTISVREAARLQSFPDGFIFAGTMNPAFRQIGNAVPPLLAKAIAGEMMKQIRGNIF